MAAAGSGARFGEPKQFLELRPGVRLVDQAVLTCRAVADWVGVILPEGVIWDGPPVDGTCVGAASRLDSLRAGLAIVPDEVTSLLTHSASHPLASPELAAALLDAVGLSGSSDVASAAVPFLAAVDVIKRQDGAGRLTTVGRETMGAAQCPMAFDRSALDAALADPGLAAEAVEESALIEATGGIVLAVPGEVGNIHIVDPDSLRVARAIAAGT